MSALCQMLEPVSELRCRQRDVNLVESVLSECMNEAQKTTKLAAKVSIDKVNFLPADSAGGVELYAKEGKIRVVSTLESRLELLSQKMVPAMRATLFGVNANRRFTD